MNCEAIRAHDAFLRDVERLGGEEAHKLHALRHLQLKTVIRESHCSPVHALCFNHTAPDGSLTNLFATVGKDQATVYNDRHLPDHVSVVAQLRGQPEEHAEGGGLQAACWMSSQGWAPHPQGDATLAVAGIDGNISVVSVVEARVVKLLRGHAEEVVELSAMPARPRLLLSLSSGGNVRLWDVPGEVCLASAQTDAACLALAADGASFVAGTACGLLYCYGIEAGSELGPVSSSIAGGSRAELKVAGLSHAECIDCVRFLPGGLVASKSTDGQMCVSDLASLQVISSWKVPGCSPTGGFAARCRFDTTPDGRFVSVGNSRGGCYVYDAATGQQLAHVAAAKVSDPVRACVLSADCRHLLAAVGDGFIFRFEYLGEQRRGGSEGVGRQGPHAEGSGVVLRPTSCTPKQWDDMQHEGQRQR